MSNESRLEGDKLAHQVAEEASRIDDGAIVDDPSVRDHPRYHQMFPVLTEAEVDKVRRFGSQCHYAKGEFLYRAGSICPGMFLLLSGKVRIVIRDGLGHRIVHTYTQRGEFTSDITQLSSKPAVVDAHVIESVEAVLLRPSQLSAMVISEADLGEKIMRALILTSWRLNADRVPFWSAPPAMIDSSHCKIFCAATLFQIWRSMRSRTPTPSRYLNA